MPNDLQPHMMINNQIQEAPTGVCYPNANGGDMGNLIHGQGATHNYMNLLGSMRFGIRESLDERDFNSKLPFYRRFVSFALKDR